MNIAKILKDCPKGTKLYSPLFGEVEFIGINSEHIIVKTYKLTKAYFYHNGRYAIGFNNTECILFPSKYNRDWSTLKPPKKEYEFKPFDKVLVRHNDQYWSCDLFSYYCDNLFVCIGCSWEQCIPYKGNEHLLGTTNNPD